MTGGKHAASTYDRMMAEIEMDEEDDEDLTGSTARHPVAVSKADAKADGGEWGQNPKPSANSAKNVRHEAKARDELSVSRPSAPRKPRSRRGSRSHDEIKGGDDSADDESDDEKEARVRHQDAKAFSGQVQKKTSQREPMIDLRQDTGALRIFVTQAPKHGSSALRCFVQRDRQGFNRFNPVYRLFLEDGKQFLLTAQKRTSNKTSNHLLSLSKTPVDRRSPLVIAKLRANWSGSSYTIFDDGLSPAKTAIDASVRNILGFVEFAYDDMGPGRLNVRIPKVLESGRASIKWSDRNHGQDHGARQAFEATLDASALLLRNKRPQFDAKSGGHVLDFQGRVNMPSVKNFQMQSDAHGDDTVVQFGRVSCQPPGPHRQCKCHKDTFTMDLRHPLSPVQAFAICLAALDAKVADAKAYECVSSLLRNLSS